MPVSESVRTELRNFAQEAIAQAKRDSERPRETQNEVISAIESARPKPSRPHARSATTTYYHRCFFCGEWSQGFSPRTLTWLIGDPERKHSCGHYPWEGLHPESQAAPNVIPDIQPYFDISCGPQTKGVTFVPGKGGYIRSRQHLRDVARDNGKLCR